MGGRRALKTVLQLALLALGILICGALLHFGDLSVLPGPDDLALAPLVGGLATTTGIVLCVALRWGSISNALGGERLATWHEYYFYFVGCQLVSLAVPKDLADLGGRTIWLRQAHKVPIARAGTSVVIDRLCDLFITLIFLVAVAPHWLGLVSAPTAVLLMGCWTLVGFLVLYFRHGVILHRVEQLARWGGGLLARLPGQARLASEIPSLELIDRGLSVRLFVLSLCKFACVVGSLVLFSLALRVPVPAELLLLGAPVAQVTYLFAFTPGGLGIFELGWFAILTFGGVAAGVASVFVVSQRLITILWLGVLFVLSQSYLTLAATRVAMQTERSRG